MNREGRYEKENRFWEIIYYLDTNELLIRTGIKGRTGTLKILSGFDGDKVDKLIVKKTNQKLKKGWKHVSKHINAEFTEESLYNYRLEKYNYDGKKKKVSKKSLKKKKPKKMSKKKSKKYR